MENLELALLTGVLGFWGFGMEIQQRELFKLFKIYKQVYKDNLTILRFLI